MTYTDNLWLFLILLAGIIIVPGMDMLFVLANALVTALAIGTLVMLIRGKLLPVPSLPAAAVP